MLNDIIIMAGEVTGSEVKTNRDGIFEKILLQVRISDIDDIQTVQLMTQTGNETRPPNGSTVLIVAVGDAWKIAIASDDDIVPSMAVGEKKLYSLSAGSISAFINLLSTGIIELNGNADFAVRYTALETAFNQLLSDFNALVTAYNLHVHPGVTVGAGSTLVTTSTGSSSSADITPAKVDEVTLP